MKIIHKLYKTNIVDEKIFLKETFISSIVKINAKLIILGKK